MSFLFEQRSEEINFVNICGEIFQSEGITDSQAKLGMRLATNKQNVVSPQNSYINFYTHFVGD